MKRILRLFLGTVGWALLALHVPAALAATVIERAGDIYFSDGSGSERRLSTSGGNAQPALSGDGQWVAYKHELKASNAPYEFGTSELWLIRTDGSEAKRLVASTPHDDPKRNLAFTKHPAFSPAGNILYFMATAWATSDAIHALSLTSGKVRYVCDGNSLDVVPKGRYAGYLVIQKHKYPAVGPATDDYWLVSPAGKEIRRVGDSEEHLARFLAKQGR